MFLYIFILSEYRCQFLKPFTIFTYRMLTRSLYKDELEPNWPSNRSFLAWDLYMRQNSIRKDRECIIPDISRTYHFGAIGMNINKDKQKKLFELRALNREPPQNLHIEDVKKNNYEKVLERLIRYVSCASNF